MGKGSQGVEVALEGMEACMSQVHTAKIDPFPRHLPCGTARTMRPLAMRGLEIIVEDTPKHINLTVEQEKSPDKSTFVTIDASESRKAANI